MLKGKGIKATIVLDPAEIGTQQPIKANDKQVRVFIHVGPLNNDAVSVHLNSKSWRRAVATIAQLGAENSTVIVQGKLDLSLMEIKEAGIIAQAKGKPSVTDKPADAKADSVAA